MDPITQGTVGALAPQAVARPGKLRAFALLGCLAGMAPDLDVFISSPTDTLLFLEYHRQFTHALLFIPVGAAIATLLLHPVVRRTLAVRESYLACLLGYATHGVLDACTSYGTQLFWPFSDVRVAWNNVSVVDPLFTLPVLILAIAAAVARQRRLALAGIAWALLYLAAGVVQNQRAEAAGVALAEQRGHEPMRLTAKAGFANLLVWKVVYEHDGRYYVDAVRVGASATTCLGTSVATLDVERDLPWLDRTSQQGRMWSAFAGSPTTTSPCTRPCRTASSTSAIPSCRIRSPALWGIDLQPGAPTHQFARFTTNRTARLEQRDAYTALLTGAACTE